MLFYLLHSQSLVELFDILLFEKVRVLKMRYETRFFKKAESLIKTVKKIFFENTKYLASTYKSGNLNDKLSKMTIYIYIYKSFFYI